MVREPDVLALPRRVAARVERWTEVLDARLPAKPARGRLRIAAWNLRALCGLANAWQSPGGALPKRNFTGVHLIAAVVRRFDVVAVQEVRGNLRVLRYLMKVLGEDWAFILTDVTEGKAGNDERLALLFNTRRVKPSGLACELVVPIEKGAGVPADELNR